MKIFFAIAILLLTKLAFSQNDDLIQLVLSDKSNFKIMAAFDENQKMPEKFYVFDTTKTWRSLRFSLKELGDKQIPRRGEEHHPYYHTFLFRDSLLDKTFSFSEREKLLINSSLLQSRNLKIKTPFASTVKSFNDIKPGDFIVWISDVVHSSDNSYAFIDFVILQKSEDQEETINKSYHSTLCVILKKENNSWKTWRLKQHLIL